MRVKSFNKLLEFEFEGTVIQNAMCLADVDNDGANELIIGNDKGQIAVFKSEYLKAVCSAKILGVVTAITVGDALNIGINVLVVITTCGQLHIYNMTKAEILDPSQSLFPLVHTQRIMANIKSVLIGDINGDGSLELVVGLTDRVVRSYRWFSTEKNSSQSFQGSFISMNKWDFAEQVGGIAFNRSTNNVPSLLVSQPGGTFHVLKVEPLESDSFSENSEEQSPGSLAKISLNTDSFSWSKMRTAEVCGNVKMKVRSEEALPGVYAVATLDGVLVLAQGDKILWKMNVEHQLFALLCLDVCCNGTDAVVACAWDGSTFIVQEGQECVKFLFKEAVSSFTAGMFTVENKQLPCLVYATFSNRVYVYYDLDLSCRNSTSLLAAALKDPKYSSVVQSLGIDLADVKKLRKLNSFALYGNMNFGQ